MPLTPLALPADDWTAWLEERGRGRLREAGDRVTALKQAAPDLVLDLWNDVGIALADAFAVSSLLAQVHPDADVVGLAEQVEVEARAFLTDLHLDVEVHERLRAVPTEGLDDGARRVLDDALRDFRRSGVDRDEDVREQVRALDQRLTDLGQRFSRNIRDGRAETRVPATALVGLPEDYVAAHPADAEGRVTISTEYPDTHPFLSYATDAKARRAVATTFLDLGWPANDEVLAALLAARHEKATLLGYAGWPDYDAEVKMVGTGAAIASFIDTITADSAAAARRDLEVLLARAGQDGVTVIDGGNHRYYSELVRREQYGVDAGEVRRYFDFAAVHDGLLRVTGRLFGVDYVPIDPGEARPWHPDVTTYDVVLRDAPDEEQGHLGRIHLDLHPRERKYNHAAMFDLVGGIAGRQLAEGVLVCNFPRGLMEHSEVVTLFHEFGHLLHHVLAGRHPWARFSGVATEWDFVEAPSQMLEEWAWDPAVLRTFAVDADGAPIPAELVERMRAAEEFGQCVWTRQQMFYAALSYRFHAERPADLAGRMRALQEEYSLVAALPDTHFYAGFGHLAGYTSAYYTYMWSLVIAKDLFSAFDEDDLFAEEVATRYRDRVLAPGGSRDAADLVADFLGRPYDTAAFTAWLERSAATDPAD